VFDLSLPFDWVQCCQASGENPVSAPPRIASACFWSEYWGSALAECLWILQRHPAVESWVLVGEMGVFFKNLRKRPPVYRALLCFV